MTEEPTNKNERSHGSDTRMPGDGSSNQNNPMTQPAASTTIGDPVRPGIGDKPDDPTKRTDTSKLDDKGSKTEPVRTGNQRDHSMGGERKGSSMEAGPGASEHRAQGDRAGTSTPDAQRNKEGQKGSMNPSANPSANTSAQPGKQPQQGEQAKQGQQAKSDQHGQQPKQEQHGGSDKHASQAKPDQKGQQGSTTAMDQSKKSDHGDASHKSESTQSTNPSSAKTASTGKPMTKDGGTYSTDKAGEAKSAHTPSAGGVAE